MTANEIWQVIQPVVTAIGALIIGGGALTTIAYWLFRQFAKNWLESKFAERLQSLKHSHESELEELKFKINTLFDRKIKLHQREFEIVPHAWTLLHDLYREASFLTGLATYPDLDRLPPPDLDEFLETTQLTKWEKRELLAAAAKTKYFIGRVTLRNLFTANKKYFEFYFYLSTNGIFIAEALTKPMYEIGKIIRHALVAKEIQFEHGSHTKTLTDALMEFTKIGERLKELEVDVRQQFWASQKL